MSGGHFDYKQHTLTDIANEIKRLIVDSHDSEAHGDEEAYFSEDTLDRLIQAVATLEIAAVYVQRIDWLVSGDDSETTFHQRLGADLHDLEEIYGSDSRDALIAALQEAGDE